MTVPREQVLVVRLGADDDNAALLRLSDVVPVHRVMMMATFHAKVDHNFLGGGTPAQHMSCSFGRAFNSPSGWVKLGTSTTFFVRRESQPEVDPGPVLTLISSDVLFPGTYDVQVHCRENSSGDGPRLIISDPKLMVWATNAL